MSDKADYTGQINAKKVGGTGITEGILGRHHRAKAGRMVIVANVHVAQTHDNIEDGTGAVNYVIDELEVAPAEAEEHVRELIRSFQYERALEQDDPTLDLDRGNEPTVVHTSADQATSSDEPPIDDPFEVDANEHDTEGALA
jgi:hypothetical protein